MIPLTRIVSAAAVVMLSSSPPQTIAQDSTPVMEEVRVLGSHIRRQDFASASPVLTLESEAIQLNGAQTLGEFLNRYPQFTPDNESSVVNPGYGNAVLNMRGLGAQRSLIMLNGRRVGPSNSDGTVDINSIPTALVERVEILTGGASTVYGSDAVTGVVNVLLRRDFDGLELGGNFMVTDEDDGESYDLTLAAGTGFDGGRGHISGFVGYTNRDPVKASARDFSRYILGDDLEIGELVRGGSPVTSSGHIFEPGFVNGEYAEQGITFDADGTARPFTDADYYNYQELVYLQTGLERYSIALFGEYELNDTTRLHLDFMASENENESRIAPTPGFGFFTINTDNPTLTAQAQAVLIDNFDPGGTGFVEPPFGRRMTEVGPRLVDIKRTAYFGNLGVEGRWLDDWRWSIDYTHSYTRTRDNAGNQASYSRLQQALLVDPTTGACFDPTDGCVAANIFGEGNMSQEAADFIRFAPFSNRDTIEQQVASLVTSGDWQYYGERNLSMALGLEWRKDQTKYRPATQWQTGDVLGANAISAVNGDYDVWEAFIELLLPLVQGQPFAQELNLEAGYRYSDYSTVGDVSTYKGGLSWRPIDSVLVRGMAQRAVRAPNLTELFEAHFERLDTSSAFGLSFDPCSASEDPVGQGYTELCISQGLPADQVGVFEANPFYPSTHASGGNVNLEEEKADTVTLGATWQPDMLSGLSVALDYYSIEIDNAIEFIDYPSVLCFQLNQPGSAFCQGVERAPSGDISRLESSYYNVAAIASKGYDLELIYEMELPELSDWSSRLRLSVLATKITEMSFQGDPTSEKTECKGYFSFPCSGAFPEYRTITHLTWMTGPLTANLAWRWMDGMDDKFPSVADDYGFGWATFATPEIDSYDTYDLSLSYAVGEDIMLVAGVINLTDEEPPILGDSAEQNNTLPGTYDTLGRRYHASFTMRF
jgi:iron complex outermembrane receptor protein